jgi:hypothetical protein
MDVLIERCAGLDVHRDTVVATVRRPGPGGVRRSETRTFTTMTGQLEALADWLAAQEVTLVGMESTGIYWKPVYCVLEDHFPVWVINAEHLRNVPGRKTDVADSMWIAQLIEHGLVSPSFVPPRHVDRQVIPWPGCHVIPWLAVDVLPGLVWCCQWWRVDDFADLSGEVFGRRAAEAGGEDGLAVAAA